MKARVTEQDLDRGRALLRASFFGDGDDFNRFIRWQRECVGARDDVVRLAFSECVRMGDLAQAERMFDAMTTPAKENMWRHACATLGKATVAAIMVLVAIGMVMVAIAVLNTVLMAFK
jgi:hypothetical protein